MALTLRLTRHGTKNAPFYRIVAAEKTSPRDGRYLEIVGTYDTTKSPSIINLKEDRVKHWITHGAIATRVVGDIINKKIPGFLKGRIDHQRKKIQAARKARKQRLASKKK